MATRYVGVSLDNPSTEIGVAFAARIEVLIAQILYDERSLSIFRCVLTYEYL